jgi:hypothetical protein
VPTPKNGSLKGEETQISVASVTPDIYNWEIQRTEKKLDTE